MSRRPVNISGGLGGNGGNGGAQGGSGGTGEGPRVNFVDVQQFTMHIHSHIYSGLPPEQQGQMSSAEPDRTQIIDWLSPINFFLQHADISQERQEGTGGWLLADPRFQQWESGLRTTLWCHGIPGAGKTVLASMVVDHLTTKFQNENIVVACIYLNHKAAEDQTPAKLLSALWRQLILGRDVGPFAKVLYQRCHEKQTRPTSDEVFNILSHTVAEFSKVYIVIDAVDEYPETQRRILMTYLATIGPMVNLMITSRPHVIPHSTLLNSTTLEICATQDDIQTFVDAQITMSSRLKNHVQTRPELREEIHSKITSTVDGMFLLAKLHLETLSTKSTIKAVQQALEALPKTLNDCYDNAMKQIEEQKQEDTQLAHSTLTWVANAKRPLTPLELQTALAIEPGTKSLDSDNILDIEVIISVCAGLVIVDEQLSVVRLVHYTTQEYLDGIQSQRFPHAQTEITRSIRKKGFTMSITVRV
ncbi:hypothetical protein B0H11DRAFT_1817909 [Mycena galericulata]|nr:hypothetical protein B0H11DRAFT_1817909 [Mycena galericulata]